MAQAIPTGANHTLPHAARVVAPGDFARIQKSGRSVDLGLWVFRVAQSADGSYATAHGRLGLAVSRKVGNAVERNRAKRLARHSFRHRKELFAGMDVVAIARLGAAGLHQPDVDALFDKLLSRVRS